MMRYFSAGLGLKIWKKDSTFLSIPGLATSGLGFVLGGDWIMRLVFHFQIHRSYCCMVVIDVFHYELVYETKVLM